MSRSRRPRVVPQAQLLLECWYAVAPAVAITSGMLPVRIANRSVVLFRISTGEVVALDDCCAHRPYPLSEGRIDGDVVRCGLCGFEYDPTGRCVRVPSQSRVPIDASVAAHPVREEHGMVWIWLGEPGRASLHRIPALPWLRSSEWVTVSGELGVDAGFLLLLESLADVTKIPVLAPEIAPAVLAAALPPLDVVVSETTVALARTFPAGLLPEWQARALGVDSEAKYAHLQEGHFHSPAAWVDHWDVVENAVADSTRARLRFTHLVTPISRSKTRLHWHVSRDFALTDDATSNHLVGMFESYYPRLTHALEVAQGIIDRDGPRHEVNVSADMAALKVRGIVQAMLAEEGLRLPR